MPRAQHVDRPYTFDLNPYIERFSKLIDAQWPALTGAQIDTISQSVIPQVGQHIIADLTWSQDDLRMLDQGTSDMSDPTQQHEDTVPDPDPTSGKTLYKICLRVWHVFPTNIICPSTGLVYGTEKDQATQSKLFEMKWPKTFNEKLTEVLVNSFWDNDFYLLVSAIKFTCICAVDDRRRWDPESHGDPFFEAFLTCQERSPAASKRYIIAPIEQELKSRRKWPSKAFKIFKLIANPYMAARGEPGDNEDEDEEHEGPTPDELPWHLNTVRTSDLKRLLSALDAIETKCWSPLPSGAQKEIFIHARPQAKSFDRDEPSSTDAYVQLQGQEQDVQDSDHLDVDFDDGDSVLQGTRGRHHIASSTHESNSQSLSLSRKRPLSDDGQHESNSNKRQCSHKDTREIGDSLEKQYISPEEAPLTTQRESSRSRNQVELNEDAGNADVGEASRASIIVPILEPQDADRAIATGSSNDPIQIDDDEDVVKVKLTDDAQVAQGYASNMEDPDPLSSDSRFSSPITEAEDDYPMGGWFSLTPH
ncbi:hypothetical protein F4678DRAFT_460426 [Xylaria arbuscula]|nr:hypothetical protein F4678DRAFT_460426 [Xylaria arbuscula]